MDHKDLIATLGIALVVAGVAFVYWPAALILAGIMLFAFAYLTSGARGRKAEPGK